MEKNKKYEEALIGKETSNGITYVSCITNELGKRTIHLNGNIDDYTANLFIMQMNYLCETEEPIKIIINSLGGDVTQGLLIYDVIQNCKNIIEMYCTGIAASMAAIILAGGQKGRRYILENSTVMIHEPLIPHGAGGSATSITNMSKAINEVKEKLVKILYKHTGKSIREINKAISYDNYMDANEAVKFGIVDQVKGLFD